MLISFGVLLVATALALTAACGREGSIGVGEVTTPKPEVTAPAPTPTGEIVAAETATPIGDATLAPETEATFSPAPTLAPAVPATPAPTAPLAHTL